MTQDTTHSRCLHQVAMIGSAVATEGNISQLALEFYEKVADFNIRGGFDQIPHPGFLTEFLHCPNCGEKLTPTINKDDLLLQAVVSYDCKGRPRLEIQKAKEIEMLKKSMDPQVINDSLRLYFVITREATFYKDHPSYKPCAICYTANSGERVTLVGENAYDCIDKAMLQAQNDHRAGG
ncbi:hypothetical protein CL689_07125 [Candidatus Saccharibacteria bacterium]|nr:hypothetical protein [Candidatus Saccharibacteria bacterium]